MRSEELGMRKEQSCPQAPSEARDNAHGQARRWRACRVKGQSPLRSLRQSLIRRKPTRCRLKCKKHTRAIYQTNPILEHKICTAHPPLTFRIIVYLATLDNPTNIGRGEHSSPVLRTCRNFRIVGAGALDSPPP